MQLYYFSGFSIHICPLLSHSIVHLSLIETAILHNHIPTIQSRATPDWLNLYLCGAGYRITNLLLKFEISFFISSMEMYTDTLSPSFVGMPFPDAAQ